MSVLYLPFASNSFSLIPFHNCSKFCPVSKLLLSFDSPSQCPQLILKVEYTYILIGLSAVATCVPSVGWLGHWDGSCSNSTWKRHTSHAHTITAIACAGKWEMAGWKSVSGGQGIVILCYHSGLDMFFCVHLDLQQSKEWFRSKQIIRK